MHPPLITQDAAQAREQLAAPEAPPFPTATIGTLPTVVITVKFPRELRVADLAAMAARAGFRVRWIRRGKVERARHDRRDNGRISRR